MRSNAEDRNDAIEAIGAVNFWKIESNKIYQEPKIPPCFLFLFEAFLEIYNCCNKRITWTDIYSYEQVRKIDLMQWEVDYIIMMNSWANSKINEMNKEE